jgi:hypothetical protein
MSCSLWSKLYVCLDRQIQPCTLLLRASFFIQWRISLLRPAFYWILFLYIWRRRCDWRTRYLLLRKLPSARGERHHMVRQRRIILLLHLLPCILFSFIFPCWSIKSSFIRGGQTKSVIKLSIILEGSSWSSTQKFTILSSVSFLALKFLLFNGTRLVDFFSILHPAQELIRRRHHYRWRAEKFRPMLGAQGLWAVRGPYRATPAVTRGLGFSSLIRRTAPFSRLLRHKRGCGESIITWIFTGKDWLAL